MFFLKTEGKRHEYYFFRHIIELNLLNVQENQEKIYFENIFNPKYEELKKSIKFNKYYNIKENTKFEDSYDDIFDLIIKLVQTKL